MSAQLRWAPALSLMLTVTALLGPGQFVPATAALVPDAVVLSADANPPQLASGGGTVTVTGVVLHASTCQLELLSSQSFAVVYSHNPTSCASGSFSARATIGPNPTLVARTVAFALVARNNASGSSKGVHILLAAGAAMTTVGTPPGTTTGPASGTSVPVVASQSPNWSGYAAMGGPYTVSSVSVETGDEVTVTIWELSGTTWEINLTDDTDNQSFTTPPEQYSGPGSSAEWIVEATTDCRFRCRTVVALAPYSPPVVFSGLGMTGPQATSLVAITMVQGLGEASTPSALSGAGFTLTYTGSAPVFGTARLGERRAK